MPTLALTNSLSFHQMNDPGKEFPGIRVLGTIGWICAGFTIGRARPRGRPRRVPFQMAAAASVLLGLYSPGAAAHAAGEGHRRGHARATSSASTR